MGSAPDHEIRESKEGACHFKPVANFVSQHGKYRHIAQWVGLTGATRDHEEMPGSLTGLSQMPDTIYCHCGEGLTRFPDAYIMLD